MIPPVVSGAQGDGGRMDDETLATITLVPVEVFGTDCDHAGCKDPKHGGYGLSDAVDPWSDCNRAIGRIYRVEDMPEPTRYRGPGDVLTIQVPKSALEFFKKEFGDQAGDGG